MCGITGYKTFDDHSNGLNESLQSAIHTLRFRGPDHQAIFTNKSVGLGHTRLSIIDTSSNAHQPMTDVSGRYTLVFNGEIYNFLELKSLLGITDLRSTSDTEVLLYLLIEQGVSCLSKLNGFFALAFYDSEKESLLLARDRMGIKPLHFYHDDQFFVFGSEMKAMLSYPIPREINHEALSWYLRLTYLPSDISMIQGVKKLLPGHYLQLDSQDVCIQSYWNLEDVTPSEYGFSHAKTELVKLLEQSVQRRMIADVPLGSFLSGGTDSSAVVSIASQFDKSLSTFSIGYRDHPFFDETHYAELVAKKFNTNHTVISLTNDDLLDNLGEVVNYIDEPFADSSAIPTYILSKHVRKSIKVALSGDGADELFGGYYKHFAFSKSLNKDLLNTGLKSIGGLLKHLPQSRSSTLGNTIRRIAKYAELLRLDPKDRYLHLASFHQHPSDLLLHGSSTKLAISKKPFGLNDFLDLDLQMVLPGDMLTKVDLMSMANSLEVRVPFLDKDVVSFARSLPGNYKVSGKKRKRVLQDAFEHILPKELHHRSKKGFEVPMLHWLRNELREELEKTIFNKDYLQEQGLFRPEKVIQLKAQLDSKKPQDVHVHLWSLYVFQKWYNRYIL